MTDNTTKVTVGADGRVTIPRAIREQVYLSRGAELEVCVTPEGIVLRPIREPDQWWFWTDEWQAGEREADKAIAEGRLLGPHTDEEFEAVLAAIDRELDGVPLDANA